MRAVSLTHRFVGFEGAPDLPTFGFGNDLDQHDDDGCGPECEAEGIEHVDQQSQRFRGRRRLEQVAGDVRRETDDERDSEDLEQDPLPVRFLP